MKNRLIELIRKENKLRELICFIGEIGFKLEIINPYDNDPTQYFRDEVEEYILHLKTQGKIYTTFIPYFLNKHNLNENLDKEIYPSNKSYDLSEIETNNRIYIKIDVLNEFCDTINKFINNFIHK